MKTNIFAYTPPSGGVLLDKFSGKSAERKLEIIQGLIEDLVEQCEVKIVNPARYTKWLCYNSSYSGSACIIEVTGEICNIIFFSDVYLSCVILNKNNVLMTSDDGEVYSVTYKNSRHQVKFTTGFPDVVDHLIEHGPTHLWNDVAFDTLRIPNLH